METFNASKNFIVNLQNQSAKNTETGQVLTYDLDVKILIYEDRQKTWFFDIAEKLKEDNEAGFVILMIATSYLESSQKYRRGLSGRGGSSMERIKSSIERIFPNASQIEVEFFVDKVRNGLFHDGITKKNLFVHASQQNVFEMEGNSMTINPHLFLNKVKEDFEKYILDLKNSLNEDLRNNFEIFWNSIKG